MKLRVLIFDENIDLSITLKEILDERGYEIFTFANRGVCVNTDLIFYQNHRPCSLPKPAVILYHFIPSEKKYLHIVLLIRRSWICF